MDYNKKDNIHKKLKVFRFLIFFTIFILILGILVLFFFKMEDTVYATGKLVGRYDYEMKARVPSSIIEIVKKEGDSVKKGDVIIKLDMTILQDKIVQLQNEIKELQAEIKVKKTSYDVLKNNPLPKEYRHVYTEFEEQKKRLEQSEKNLPVYKALYDKMAISRIEYEKYELNHIQTKAALKKAEDDLNRVKDGMTEKILIQADNEIKLLEQKLASKEKILEITQQHMVDYTIIAPEDGVVTELPLPTGHYVESGNMIAKMSYIKEKKFIAYVGERYVYKIRPGQSVRITSSQYNYINFGYFEGKVIQVSELPVKKENTNLYPVEVLVTHEPYELKLGSSAEIMISTGKASIIVCLLGLNN